MSGAPVHILGWDDERQAWLAHRDGEPSFAWVHGFADAYLAACIHREVDLIVPAEIYQEWVAAGNARRYLPAASCCRPSSPLLTPNPDEHAGPIIPTSMRAEPRAPTPTAIDFAIKQARIRLDLEGFWASGSSRGERAD